ncbi:MAG: flavin reductase family protein [Burkholderiaceae bacterium]
MNADAPRPDPSHPTLAAPAPADRRHLRDCLGRFATGVTIVTACAPDGTLAGLTVNSFNSLSLDPPLVLWSLGLRASNLPVFTASTHFCVSVLRADQLELALRFSRPHADRFEDVPVHAGLGGAPLIAGALAWFECESRARHALGDHLLMIGEVRRCASTDGPALLFLDGGFGRAAALPPAG